MDKLKKIKTDCDIGFWKTYAEQFSKLILYYKCYDQERDVCLL